MSFASNPMVSVAYNCVLKQPYFCNLQQFMSRCPPSSYVPTATYNITESWTAGTSAVYTARCQPGFCGISTTLSCDAVTATLTGSYPVCTPLNLPPGQQAWPQRAESAGVTSINVTCAAGFTRDPAITSSSFALGRCTLASGSSVVTMPIASTFSCIPTGSAIFQLFRSQDAGQWWITSDASWSTTAQGTSAVQLGKLQSFSGGMVFYSPMQVRM